MASQHAKQDEAPGAQAGQADPPAGKEKQDWRLALLVAVIVAVVTSVANYVVQSHLASSATENAYRSRKLELIEAIAKKGAHLGYLRAFKVRLWSANYRECVRVTGGMKECEGLSVTERLKIDSEQRETYPFEYGKMIDADEQSADFRGLLVLAQVYFGKSVESEVDAFIDEFSKTGFIRHFVGAMRTQYGAGSRISVEQIVQLNDMLVVESFNGAMSKELSNLLSAMASEMIRNDEHLAH